MKCKNCQTELSTNCNYCMQCGAQVIKERITLKHLVSSLTDALGWDNRFWVTLRDLTIRPHVVFEKYLGGTRKQYTNPFTFFAIGATLTVLLINFCFDDIERITAEATQMQNEAFYGSLESDFEPGSEQAELRKKRDDFAHKFFVFQFKYYYYVSFLFLPFLGLLSFWVFGKPCNYGEHLVINTFLGGFLAVVGLVLMGGALVFSAAWLFNGATVLTFFYYSYAYGKYYKLSFGGILLKILKFLGILSAIILVVGLVIGVIIIVNGQMAEVPK